MELISIISNVTTAVVGVAALVFAVIQLRKNQNNHKESLAKGIYKEYLKMAVEHPHLAYPKNRSIEEMKKSNEFDRYAWFVSYALFACDEVLGLSAEREQWRVVIMEQIRFHVEYLSSPEFYETRELEGYGVEMRHLIEKVKKEHREEG